MKSLSLLLPLLTLGLGACNDASAPTAASATERPAAAAFVPTTFADSVAAAHGFAVWPAVEQLDFTFKVEAGGETRAERQWSWYPHRDSVVLHGGDVSYVRNTPLDSNAIAADGNFINDSYWLLMPFYLEWSKSGYTPTVTRDVTMPLSGDEADMLTVTYKDQGGYTPGDAYDLYVDDDYMIREWVYRKGNATEPSMTMTWESYDDLDGMELPVDHRSGADDGPRISHPDLAVRLMKE